MNIKSLTATALFLAAGFASAQAATVSANYGDVILAFRDADEMEPNSLNLEVNLGSATQFVTTAGTILNFSSKLSVADLDATYANWSGDDLIRFATFGLGSKTQAVGGQVKQTLWFGAGRADQIVQTDAPNRNSTSGQNAAITGTMKFMSNNEASFNGQNSTVNSAFATIVDGTKAGSYTFEGGKNVTIFNSIGIDTIFAEKSAVASDGTNGWALQDFYVMNPGTVGTPGTYLGTFGLALTDIGTYHKGDFIFQAGSADAFGVVIPEPSTYAVILGALTVGFVALRRRFSKAA